MDFFRFEEYFSRSSKRLHANFNWPQACQLLTTVFTRMQWIYKDAMDRLFVQGLPSGSFLTAPVITQKGCFLNTWQNEGVINVIGLRFRHITLTSVQIILESCESVVQLFSYLLSASNFATSVHSPHPQSVINDMYSEYSSAHRFSWTSSQTISISLTEFSCW